MEDRRFPKLETYYTTLQAMQERFDAEYREDRLVAADVEEYIVWKHQTRKLLAKLIGLPKMKTCDLKPEILEVVELPDGITREKAVIQVEPGIYMPMFILIPKEIRKGAVQCFVALHPLWRLG